MRRATEPAARNPQPTRKPQTARPAQRGHTAQPTPSTHGPANHRPPGTQWTLGSALIGRLWALPARARALPALVMLFALAGAMRLSLGIDGALAQAPMPAGPAPTVATATAPQTDTPQGADAPPHMPTDAASGEAAQDPTALAAMLIDLRNREAALAAQTAQIAERQALLAGAEARIAQQIASLRDAEAVLDATMTRADRIAAEDLGQLVAVFEAMRPEQAAQVFAEMEPGFAAGFLGQLRPATAAGILAGLEPAQAYALSATLAGRNAIVPRRAAAP